MATTVYSENKKSFNIDHTQQMNHQPTIIGYPPNNYVVQRSYCEILQKNQPQSNSVFGGIALLFVSGLHIGWGIWRIDTPEPWTPSISQDIFIFITMSWYIFAVLGGIIGAVLVTRAGKKMIYYTGGAILVTSNILYIAVFKQHAAIIVGRCLAGLAHGIVYNAVITHASENVVKEIRGMLMSTINCCMFSGIFVSSTLIASVRYRYNSDISSDTIFGIFGLVFSILGIISTMFLSYESIPYLLRRGKDSQAVVNMLKLRNESVMTGEVTDDLNEMRLMVAEDKEENQNIFSNGNGRVAGRMVALRILANLTNNLLLNSILTYFTALLLYPSSIHLAPLILTGTRFGVSFFPIMSTDFNKRKLHLTASGTMSGLLLLVLAIIYASAYQTGILFWIPGAFAITFQVIVALGIDPMQHLLVSEAFSTSKKAYSIAYVTTAENLSQILLVGVFFIGPIDRTAILITLFISAGVMLVLVLLLQLTLPETLRKTLRETRDLFRK